MPLPPTGPTVEVPPAGLRFAAPVSFAAASAEPGARGRRFSGVAYDGGVIRDHEYWDAVVFDLAGLSGSAPMHALLEHDPGQSVGVLDRFANSGAAIDIAGSLFTGIEPLADTLAAKADAGAPWELSVRIFPDKIERLRADETAVVNGRTVPGGTAIFRSSRVREVSFVALGAAPNTRATVFNLGGSYVASLVTSTKEPHMSDTNDLAAKLAAMTGERDAALARANGAETKLAEANAQFAARAKSEREAALKIMLGDEFTAELAAPYLDMSATQFAAVQARETTLRSKLPPGFTTEFVTAGATTGDLAQSPLLASARQMFNIK